ncbi:MAG TPA: DUF1801 domain-containing protein [Candidatus Bathyarchaeia archaeon]|nr:DUF1801 domain-containing protein [Candidatus Bathyarchaeia archaeon]
MVKPKPKTIEEIMSKAEPERKETAERLRSLIKSAVPKAAETVRRGKITFNLDGKDFAAIRLTKTHVDLLFSGGDRLSSPHLKGQGTISDPKHLQVTNIKSLNIPEVTRLLKDAATIVQGA